MEQQSTLKRRKGFFITENGIFDFNLNPNAFTVYSYLLRLAGNDSETAFPAQATIAKNCWMSRSTVQRSLDLLIELGLLEVERRLGFTNLYYINEPSEVPQKKPKKKKVASHRRNPDLHLTDATPASQRSNHLHLTDAHTKKQLTNTRSTNTTTELDNVVVIVEKCLEKRVKLSDLKKWVEQYGKEQVLAKAQYIGATRAKYQNVIGAFRSALEQNWDISAFTEVTVSVEASSKQRDNRYSEFYKLFGDY